MLCKYGSANYYKHSIILGKMYKDSEFRKYVELGSYTEDMEIPEHL